MKVKCEYCGKMINDTLTTCPYCGAPSPKVMRTAEGEPKTIEELKQWYIARKLPPYETTRFFIGIDYKYPKAFGIYFDEKEKIYIVYKNKANGERAVRYRGTDEAYAVNELLTRLKQEILQQKANSIRKGEDPFPASRNRSVRSRSRIGSVLKKVLIVQLSCFGAVVLAMILTVAVIGSRKYTDIGYYNVNGTNYYHASSPADAGWFIYDDVWDDWFSASSSSIPGELLDPDTAEDFYCQYSWDESTQINDFKDSAAGKAYQAEQDAKSDDNDYDSDYDWDSGSDWDSGDSDWDSDW